MRAKLTRDEAGFIRAEGLAREAYEAVEGDPGLAASALSFLALARLWRAETLTDMLALESAQLATLRALRAVFDFVGDDAAPDQRRATCSVLITHCAALVRAAERVLSERLLRQAGEHVNNTEHVFAEAGLSITSGPTVDTSDGPAVVLAVAFGMLRSRLHEALHLGEGDTEHLDAALALSLRCFDCAHDGGFTEGMASSGSLFTRQVSRRFEHDDMPEELAHDLIFVMQQGLFMATPGSVECVRLLADWGAALYGHARIPERKSAALIASLIYETCCEELLLRDLESCVYVARMWARIVEGELDAASALKAYEFALRATRRLTGDHAVESHRLVGMQNAGELHTLAAAAFAGAGETAAAAEIAEAGRSITLQPIVAPPSRELDELRASGETALVDEYLAAAGDERRVLNETRMWDAPVPPGGDDEHAAVLDRIAGVLERRRRAEEAIRSRPGHERFPRGLTYAHLRQAAADAPLAYIAAGRKCGSIILLRDESAEAPEHIALPLLTEAELDRRVFDHLEAWREWDPEQEWSKGWPEVLDAQGEWLWDAAVGPLLDAVGDRYVRLVPMGRLMALPIQTAWTESVAGGRTYAIDRATLSYLPSAAARLRAQTRLVGEHWKAALIDDPEDDFGDSREIDAAQQRFASNATRLAGAAATAAAVLEALSRSNIAHVSAHGSINEADPRKSSIVLANGEPLTLERLSRAPNADLELLVLSSCDTAIAGGSSLDQGLSFPGLMYGVSAKAVIATQWAVDVTASSRIFESFYDGWDLSHDPRATAEALRRAQLEVRDSGFDHPLWWAGFVHIG